MKKTNNRVVMYARKRKGLTDYRKRLKLLLSNKPRLVVRRSLKNILAQVVEYNAEGDKIIVSSWSGELKGLGWKLGNGNLPSAYLVGVLVGKKAKEKGLSEMVLDMGLQNSIKGSRIYALVKGVVDAGINIPHSPEMLPDSARITGKHIEQYAGILKKDQEAYKKQFGNYLKEGIDPSSISKQVEDIKNKILGVNNARR